MCISNKYLDNFNVVMKKNIEDFKNIALAIPEQIIGNIIKLIITPILHREIKNELTVKTLINKYLESLKKKLEENRDSSNSSGSDISNSSGSGSVSGSGSGSGSSSSNKPKKRFFPWFSGRRK